MSGNTIRIHLWYTRHRRPRRGRRCWWCVMLLRVIHPSSFLFWIQDNQSVKWPEDQQRLALTSLWIGKGWMNPSKDFYLPSIYLSRPDRTDLEPATHPPAAASCSPSLPCAVPISRLHRNYRTKLWILKKKNTDTHKNLTDLALPANWCCDLWAG